MRIKPYDELTFSDDYMFYKVMMDKELCRKLLETILGIKIKDVKYLEEQKTIENDYQSRGIRLDVYVEDDNNTIYNCEMQATETNNLPKRSRYYQGMIDLTLIKRGEDYNNLNKVFIIFICKNDIFGKGMPVYTFENRCIEDLSLSLSDDSVKVFLNASADLSQVDMSVEKKNLLHYVAFGEPEDDFTRNIDKAVQIVKSNEEWRKEYMKFESLQAQARAEGKAEGLAEGRAEGLAEGRAEGLAQGKAETVKSFYNSGRINEQDAATELGISVDEFLSMIKQ